MISITSAFRSTIASNLSVGSAGRIVGNFFTYLAFDVLSFMLEKRPEKSLTKAMLSVLSPGHQIMTLSGYPQKPESPLAKKVDLMGSTCINLFAWGLICTAIGYGANLSSLKFNPLELGVLSIGMTTLIFSIGYLLEVEG